MVMVKCCIYALSLWVGTLFEVTNPVNGGKLSDSKSWYFLGLDRIL